VVPQRALVCGARATALSDTTVSRTPLRGTHTCFSNGGFCKSEGCSGSSWVVMSRVSCIGLSEEDLVGFSDCVNGGFALDTGDATMSMLRSTLRSRQS